MISMIRAKIKYGGRIVDITFPQQEKKLHELLGEDGVTLKKGSFFEIVFPKELELLQGQMLDLDEINFLAKRLESFDQGEWDVFSAVAQQAKMSNVKDLINLTFSNSRYTLIQDLRSMEEVGKAHLFAMNGCITETEMQSTDFAQIGRDLLATGRGQYTEHGILFVNEDRAFNVLYDGQVFPPYYYRNDFLLSVKIGYGGKNEYVFLPDDDLAITKALNRLGAASPSQCTFKMEDFCVDSKEWHYRFERMLEYESIFDVNALATAINYADTDLDKLTALVGYAEDDSRYTITKLARYEEAFRKALGAKKTAEARRELTAKKRTLQRSEIRLNDLDKLFKRSYEDMVNGTINKARFKMLSDSYEEEQEELRQKIATLENEIQNHEDQVESVDKFIHQAKKYLHLEEMTPTVLNDMVNAVYVHAPDKSSGHRVQDVDISYNYIGILPANLLYDIQNGKTA